MVERSKQVEALASDVEKLWADLVDGNRYQIPETPEDLQKLGPFPYFTIGHKWVYASDEVRCTLLKFAEVIRNKLGPDIFSLSTVADAIRDEVKSHFSSDQAKPLTERVASIIDTVVLHNRRRLFLRVLHGLDMHGISEIAHGSWRIVRLTNELVEEFASRDVGDDLWKSHIRDFLKDAFLGRTCILVECTGDREQARAKAAEIAQFVVNSFRYFASIHLTGVGRAHVTGLRLDEPSRHRGVDTFEQTLEKYESTILGADKESRQAYPINQENLARLRADWDAESLWSLAEKTNRTDLEQAIVTAVTWFGDAHNEEDVQVSYVKYWIALEALVTAHRRGRVSGRLKEGIRVMLKHAMGMDVNKSEIQRAYGLRSEIAHGVCRSLTTWRDRNIANQWACQCIALCLRLCGYGYTDRQQIEHQTARIDRILSEAEQRRMQATGPAKKSE